MTACPEIEELLREPPDPDVASHCRSCAACDAISALSALRQVQRQSRSHDEQDCIRTEVSLAEAAVHGPALDSAHLQGCAACGEVAVRAQALRRSEPPVTFVELKRERPLLTPLRLAVSAMAVMLLAMIAVVAAQSAESSEPAPIALEQAPSQPPASAALPLLVEPLQAAEPPASAEPTVRARPGTAPRPAAEPRLLNPFAESPAARAGVGYLTVVCDPFCTQIFVDGRAFGSSPLVRAPLAPGVRHVDLIRDSLKKRISVSIKDGQITARRVQMSHSELE